MKKNFIYLMLSVMIIMSGCSTKLDVTGNWKETLVVYGLMDQTQPKQYIKINKAFLGEGNAYQMARIKDSTQFVHALNVKIQRVNPAGVVVSEFALTPDNSIAKDTGIFYSPDQTNVIYSFPTPISYTPANLYGDSVTTNATLPESDQYRLVVKNSETGNEVTAMTPLVNRTNFTRPSPAGTAFGFVSTFVPNLRFYVEWVSSRNARIYDLTVRFNYIDSTATGNVSRYIDWHQYAQKTAGLDGSEVMSLDFAGMEFIRYIGSHIPVDPSVIKRFPGKVDLLLTGGANDLDIYMDVNKPSTGLVQERPAYTNITNGLGIFSARYKRYHYSRPMSDETQSELSNGVYTNCLKFVYHGAWVNHGSCF